MLLPAAFEVEPPASTWLNQPSSVNKREVVRVITRLKQGMVNPGTEPRMDTGTVQQSDSTTQLCYLADLPEAITKPLGTGGYSVLFTFPTGNYTSRTDVRNITVVTLHISHDKYF